MKVVLNRLLSYTLIVFALAYNYTKLAMWVFKAYTVVTITCIVEKVLHSCLVAAIAYSSIPKNLYAFLNTLSR